MLSGNYVLCFLSVGYQNVWIDFTVSEGELMYLEQHWDWIWMEYGLKKYPPRVDLPMVTSTDGLVTKADVSFTIFQPDEQGSFAYIDSAALSSATWTVYSTEQSYIDHDEPGSFVICYKSPGYMYYSTYFDVWWSESIQLQTATFVSDLAPGQVQFVME